MKGTDWLLSKGSKALMYFYFAKKLIWGSKKTCFLSDVSVFDLIFAFKILKRIWENNPRSLSSSCTKVPLGRVLNQGFWIEMLLCHVRSVKRSPRGCHWPCPHHYKVTAWLHCYCKEFDHLIPGFTSDIQLWSRWEEYSMSVLHLNDNDSYL